MIKLLRIENYQSHKNNTITFDKGVNVIVGKSDTGKSAIIKAMNWCINNKPVGTSFFSHWDNKCFVSLSFYDSTPKISRSRNKKENIYYIDNECLKAVNKEVPMEVQTVVNMSDINLQRQGDNHFLISNTPGEVAKYLNKVVNIDQIDRSLSNIESLRRETTKNINKISSEIDDIENKLQEYVYISRAEKKLRQLLKSTESIRDMANSYYTITDLYNKIQKINNDLNKFSNINKAYKKINQLSIKIKILEKDNEIFNNLNNFKHQFYNCFNLYKKEKEKNDKLKTQYNKLIEGIEICPVCNQKIPKT
jgi:DNA repair ATPase RecN